LKSTCAFCFCCVYCVFLVDWNFGVIEVVIGVDLVLRMLLWLVSLERRVLKIKVEVWDQWVGRDLLWSAREWRSIHKFYWDFCWSAQFRFQVLLLIPLMVRILPIFALSILLSFSSKRVKILWSHKGSG